jgi:hypothetical protein
MAVPSVDGALVGGASLKAEEFLAIAGAPQRVRNLIVLGMCPGLSVETREVVRRLEASTRAEVRVHKRSRQQPGCHCLFPRGVGIPASLSAAAMPCRLVTPLACSASMVGRKPAARLSARAIMTLRAASPGLGCGMVIQETTGVLRPPAAQDCDARSRNRSASWRCGLTRSAQRR